MPRIILGIFLLTVWIYGVIDCVRTDRSRMPGRVAKPLWFVFVLFVPAIGSAVWILVHLLKNDKAVFDSMPGFSRRSPEPRGPVAPDDDPEFLARLDAQRRRREYEERRRMEQEAGEEKNDGENHTDPHSPRRDDDDDHDGGGLYGSVR